MPGPVSAYEAARQRLAAARAKRPPVKSWMQQGKDAIGGVADVAVGAAKGMGDAVLQTFNPEYRQMRTMDTAMDLSNEYDNFRGASTKGKIATALSVPVEQGLGIPVREAYNEAQQGNYGRAIGQIGGGIGLGLLAHRGMGRLAPKPPVPAPRPIAGLLPEHTTPRFIAGERGIVDARASQLEDVGAIRPDFSPDQGTVLPQERNQLHAVDPYTRANYQGTGQPAPMRDVPSSAGMDPFKNFQTRAFEALVPDRYKTIHNVQPFEGSVVEQPKPAFYPKTDPNVPGIGDVGALDSRITGMEPPPQPKPVGKGKTARLTQKKNSQGVVVPEMRDTNLAPAADAVKRDQQRTVTDTKSRPYAKLSDNDLMTLGTRGDAAAIKEMVARKRGEVGSVDPSQARPSLAERFKSESGSVLLEPFKKSEPIDFNKPVPAGGGKGNIFHRIVNPVFDTNFANWVNARRATAVEGLIKRREFKDLDAAGFDGITAFQEGLLKGGRFADVKNYFDAKHDTLQQAGVKLGFRENYLPQLWDNTANEVFQVSKRLGLKPQFTIERVLENYKQGIEHGLKPKFKTIGELMGWYESRANKAIADRQFFDHLRETKQILPEGKAPSEWQTINPDNFPVQKFKTSKGEFVTKNYKAPAPIAKAINNYLGEGHEAFRWVGDKASITKNVVLSSGVPFTGINAHGFNIAARNVMAKGLLRGGAEAAKYLVHPKSAKNWFDANIASAPDAVKHGLTLTTEEHQIGSSGSSHLLREPQTKVGAVLNKGFNALLKGQGKAFEDPLFQNVIPALKLKHWQGLAADMMKGGMEETAAKKSAADATNSLYGGINWEAMQRSRDLQNLMRGIILAPDWFESQYRIGKGAVNTVRSGARGHAFDPQGLPYKRVAMNLLASYIAADVVNYSINDKHMWENESGHALDIKAGTVGGKTRWIRPFGTAADFARLPFDTLAGMAKGDLSAPGNILKNRFSTVTRPALDLIMNQDAYGNPIFGQDKYGRAQSIPKQLGAAGREVASAVTPQYIRGGIDYATGKAKSKEEAILGAVEAPVRYSRESTKRHSRYRSTPRRSR